MTNISCILYPPTLDYYYLVQRPQHLMQSFARLGINCFYLNNPQPQSKVVRGIDNVIPNLYLFNNVDPAPYLKDVKPVVYYTSAAQADLVLRYNPSLVIFDSVDDPSDEFAAWLPFYEKAVSTADIVLTTSDKLFARASKLNPSTYLVPNGCDFEHFSRWDLPVPDDVANIKRPVIGYVGVVATWVDLELVAKLADAFPEYSIVMVGPLYNVTRVPYRPNIYWMGYKDYKDLPLYVRVFDIGIIPFKQTTMVEAVNPIKMWEYMASGIPVVSTSLPEVQKYGDLIYTAATHEQFIEMVVRALAEDSPEKREKRIFTARQNSWMVRAKQIVKIIEEKLTEKEIKREEKINPSYVAALAEKIMQDAPQDISYLPAVSGFGGRLKVGRRWRIKLTTWPNLYERGKVNRFYFSRELKINIIKGPAFYFRNERG
ncbi:Glycosyl transferases group 1 [Thermosyntropha lipolytica DSM 11003]|uniref:Glycosyl transferases group 1 n=1 Tax=Thermosyntropha lipolytica DSM 11003 TaxID=1123382 RepID=A0A1M5JP42_9FIRM|nr:glycosyltransferase [Thermosyntropha lipolytica]SHG42050.1 Glycosyl transferases group 1 [Thermosyntropha lipolytica DSM 11003]